MELTAEQSALATALDHLRNLVARRNTIPILSNVMMSAKGGVLSLAATDLDIEVTESLSASVAVPGAVTAPAHMLADIVKKMPKGSEIKMTAAKTGGITVAAGRSRFELATLPKEDFPAMEAPRGGTTFTMGAAEFRGLINRVSGTVSTEETRFYLNGFYFHVTNEGLRAVSTDGHRLTRYTTSLPAGADGMPGVIVPRMTAATLARLLDGADCDVSITVTDTKIIAEFGVIRLVSKLIDGTFPDYQRVIPSGNTNILDIGIGELATAVDRVTAISMDRTRAVKITLAPKVLTVTMQSSEAGTATEEIDVSYAGNPLEIGFNSKYLSGMLGGMAGDRVQIAMCDAGSPTILTDPSDESTLYVLMPMRV